MSTFTYKRIPAGADPRRAHLDDREPLKKAAENANSRIISMLSDDQKQPKLTVDYQPAHTSDRCGRCINGMFEPGKATGTCRVVAGDIAEGDWCEEFWHRPNLSRHAIGEAADLAQPGPGRTGDLPEPKAGTTNPAPAPPAAGR